MSVWKTNDPDVKKILYIQTHGEKDPERTATPFFLATAGAAMDNEVCIYFTMNGPQCVAKANGEKIVIPRSSSLTRRRRWACVCSSASLRSTCTVTPWTT